SQAEVALLVLWWHAALVDEPHLDGVPALELVAQQLIGEPGAPTAAEREVRDAAIAHRIAKPARRLGGCPRGCALGVGAARYARHAAIASAWVFSGSIVWAARSAGV